MLNLISNLKQLNNDLLLLYGLKFKKGRVPESFLYTTTMELSSICNLRCPLCPVGTNIRVKDSNFLSIYDFDKIIQLTYNRTREYILSMWGEPLLHPDLFYIMDRLKDRKIQISSNLNFSHKKIKKLSEYENLTITGALDTYSEEKYLKYRKGADYSRVVENIKILAKGRCQAKALIFIESSDPGELNKNRAFVKSLGISPEFIRKREKNENFINRNIGVKEKNLICNTFSQGLYFNCEGYLLACCKNIGDDLKLKHVLEYNSLKQLNLNEDIVKMRERLGKDKNQFKSCQSCNGFDYQQFALNKFALFFDALKEKYLK